MSILEALRSGKRFKRPGWDVWISKSEPHTVGSISFSNPMLCKDDVLANDWIVDESPQPIHQGLQLHQIRP